MAMTKETFAEMINGRQIGDELSKEDERLAKRSGLVVVFGYSDDNVELRGSIEEEVGAFDGCDVLFVNGDVLAEHEECECDFCGYKDLSKRAKKITAIWDAKDAAPTWTFKTDIPHAKFMIYEDDEAFCQGLVFDVAEVK